VPTPPWQTLSKQYGNTSYTCEKKQKQGIRYPGESCANDKQCIQQDDFTSLCKNEMCTGVGEGLSCSKTFECMKGLYCDKKKFRTCVKQKDYGNSCSTSDECKNMYLCHEGKCSLKPFSLNIGTQIDNDNDKFSYAKCKLGWIDGQYRCTQLIQKDTSDDGGFIKCKLRDTCHYSFITDSASLYTQDCECDYSSTGQGYCPKGQNKSKILIKFRFTKMVGLLFRIRSVV
jgi:hypothetical protein